MATFRYLLESVSTERTITWGLASGPS